MGSLLAKLMGNAESSSQRTPPESIKQINTSLFELYSPSGAPEIDILFFHGLQLGDYKDAYWTTWSSDTENGTQVWPITLLSEAYPRARIMSVSYDSCARATSTGGNFDIVNIGDQLVADLVYDTDAAVGVNRPVILVGHSLGGIVIKQVILHADSWKHRLHSDVKEEQSADYNSLAAFLKNVSGIVYYSTPHGGSRLADYATNLRGTSAILELLRVFNKETARLNDGFRDWRKKNAKPALTFYELLPTVYEKVFSAVVVNEASAKVDSDKYYPVNADHIKICKPTKITDSHYKACSQFIQKVLAELNLSVGLTFCNVGETISMQ